MMSQYEIANYLAARSRANVKIAAAARELDQRGIYTSIETAEAIAQKLAARYGLTGGNTCDELTAAIRRNV